MSVGDRLMMALFGVKTDKQPTTPQDEALVNVFGRPPQETPDEAFRRLQLEQRQGAAPVEENFIQRALGSLFGR